jgi:hypothetical protein
VSVDTSPPIHDTPEPPDHRLSGRAKLGAAVVLASLTIMWLIIAVGHFTSRDPDRLDDRATTAAADQVCAQARAGVPEAPSGRNAETATARADRLDAETAALTNMVDQLGALRWSSAHDQQLVDAWLGDWRQHLSDRTVYAESVRATQRNDVLFNGAAPDGTSITYRMIAFADTNHLDACLIPDDPEIPA